MAISLDIKGMTHSFDTDGDTSMVVAELEGAGRNGSLISLNIFWSANTPLLCEDRVQQQLLHLRRS